MLNLNLFYQVKLQTAHCIILYFINCFTTTAPSPMTQGSFCAPFYLCWGNQNILHDISINDSLIDFSEKKSLFNTNARGAFTETLSKNVKYKNTKFIKASIFLQINTIKSTHYAPITDD